jgi:hypothetical protein
MRELGLQVGAVIGKGGTIIKQLREETGAKIKVGEPHMHRLTIAPQPAQEHPPLVQYVCNRHVPCPTHPATLDGA